MNPSPYRIVFPAVLSRLDYAHKLTPSDVMPVELPDARDVLRWYFTEMTGGVAYEQRLNESWNSGSPHVLVRENFTNARNVSSMGWSYATLPPVLDKLLPELETIPPWADLFDTEAYDPVIGELVDVLNGQKGFGIANATKLFYQKRPRIVPILDQFNRMVLNVPWMDADVVTPALQTIRRIAEHDTNAVSLANLRYWIRANPSMTSGLPFSTVRILDILAWGVIRQRTDSATEADQSEAE